jgi:hypothetical protein
LASFGSESSTDQRKSKKVKLDKNRVIRKTSVDLYQDQKDWLDKHVTALGVPNMGVLFRTYVDKLISEHDEARVTEDTRSIPVLESQIKLWKEMLAKEDFTYFRKGELIEMIKRAERTIAFKRARASVP